MPALKVTKRPGRKHYYAWLEGRYISTGQTDQRVALQVAQRMASVGVEAYRAGKRHLSDDLADLIEEHLTYLAEHDNRGPEHIRKKQIHLMRPVEQGCFRTLRDVQKRSFVSWLDSLGCGPKTRNEYQTSWNVFLDWLVFEDRLDENPIRGKIRRARVRPEDSRKRRALTQQEIARLLAVAGQRELLYLAAVTTGARKNELHNLKWSDVHEDRSDPCIHFRPETTKNRKGRTQPISHELAHMLAAARPQATASDIFPTLPNHHTFNKDLSSAGIEKETDDGVACFHSLRHTFTTIIARESKDVRLAQRLADHADITTTQRYLHTESSEHASVMQAFPRLRATGRASEVVQSGPIVSNCDPASPSVSAGQVSVTETLRPSVSNSGVRSLSMEPGGIETLQNRVWRPDKAGLRTRALTRNAATRRRDPVVAQPAPGGAGVDRHARPHAGGPGGPGAPEGRRVLADCGCISHAQNPRRPLASPGGRWGFARASNRARGGDAEARKRSDRRRPCGVWHEASRRERSRSGR